MTRSSSNTSSDGSKPDSHSLEDSSPPQAIETLTAELTMSTGGTIEAELDVVPRFASCFEDLQINVGRFEATGGVRLLTRFFDVYDPQYKAFAPSLVGSLNWMLTEEDVKPDACVFKAGEFGYRLVLMSKDPKRDIFEAFAKESVVVGLVEKEGNVYVSVRLGKALSAISRIDAQTFCDATRDLPPLDRAHGNGIMLEMRSFTDHRMAAVRFVRLPNKFMSDLKRRLEVQAGRSASVAPATPIAGVFAGDQERLSGAAECVGDDCRVFGAYVTAEALGKKW
jgi:hypothetical protein